MDSILTSVKKYLGIDELYTHFDTDIIMFINSAFMNLSQLGIGPNTGFSIKDKVAVWDDYILESDNMEGAKLYLYLFTRLNFDPPSSSFVLDALNRQSEEILWRLRTQAESNSNNI